MKSNASCSCTLRFTGCRSRYGRCRLQLAVNQHDCSILSSVSESLVDKASHAEARDMQLSIPSTSRHTLPRTLRRAAVRQLPARCSRRYTLIQAVQKTRVVRGPCYVTRDVSVVAHLARLGRQVKFLLLQNIDTDQIIPAEYLTLVPSKVGLRCPHPPVVQSCKILSLICRKMSMKSWAVMPSLGFRQSCTPPGQDCTLAEVTLISFPHAACAKSVDAKATADVPRQLELWTFVQIYRGWTDEDKVPCSHWWRKLWMWLFQRTCSCLHGCRRCLLAATWAMR